MLNFLIFHNTSFSLLISFSFMLVLYKGQVFLQQKEQIWTFPLICLFFDSPKTNLLSIFVSVQNRKKR